LKKVFIGCSILDGEIKQVMQEMDLQNEIVFIDAALHVNIVTAFIPCYDLVLKNAIIFKVD